MAYRRRARTNHWGFPALATQIRRIASRRALTSAPSDRANGGARLDAGDSVVPYHGRMAEGKLETEAKWRLDERGHDGLRTLLREAGGAHTGTVL